MEVPGQGSGPVAAAPPEPGNEEAPPPAEGSPTGPARGTEDGRLRPGAKRVTFPSDEDIVSGAVEPKDPWRHAQNVTVDEIMTAYKQACQKLNCKQIPKLLKQIQEFKDLAPRIECLDLKGEKLDYKACEALEEIFKRVQFKIVDLEQTSLDEDTNCLQYLDARNTPLLDHSAPFVARALRISSSLLILHLENASLSGRPLMLLATALKMNMNLRELYLADNKLNGLQDSAQLGNLLKFNCQIQILDLRNNHILDSGLAYICEGLKEQRKGLVTLVLWNNQLTHTGMAYLGMTLPHTQSLETLNLGHNPIGNEGVRNLKNGLIGNRSVLRLGLASTKLTCEGAVAVAEFIAESPRLLRLDLRENEIKTGGLMALSLALKVNHSLLRLDLDREPKKESVKSFIETQKALLAEIQNGCKRNFVLAKEKEEKEQKLQQSASMPEITVTEPLEEGSAEDGRDGNAASAPEEREDGEETPTASENGDAEPAEDDDDDRGDVTDSDSDTDEEADVGLETKDLSQPPKRLDSADGATAPQPLLSPEKPRDRPPPLHIAEESQRDAGAGSSAASPASAPSQGNERRISVSSPGRGHKIFVVTRVESLPERAADAARPREDADAAAKPAEPQSPAPATKPELPTLRANRAVAESAVGSAMLPAAPSAGSDPERGNPAACESVAHDTPLPNGLKTDFARALPETSSDGDGKMGSCAAEHELSCSKNEQELEELLLEASQDAGQEPL
ncbi:protein phosphatase 1 regulatory subunit 37 isoform 2-T2 [Sarcoramphus papa]